MGWGGTARLRVLLLGTTAVHVGIWVVLVQYWSDWHPQPSLSAICTPPLVWMVGVLGVTSVMVAVAVVLAFNMRLLLDVFAIRTELMFSGLVFLVGSIPLWAVRTLLPDLEEIPTLNIMSVSLSLSLSALLSNLFFID